MGDYCIPLMPHGLFAHPIRADVLAGRLCAHFAQSEGDAGARRFIEAAQTGAFRLSDPCPPGCLPLPEDDPVASAPLWDKVETEFRAAVAFRLRGRDPGPLWHALRQSAGRLTHVRKAVWRAGLSRPALVRDRIQGAFTRLNLWPAVSLPWEKEEDDAAPPGPVSACQARAPAGRLDGAPLDAAPPAACGVFYPPGGQYDLYLRCEPSELPRYTGALACIGMDGYLKHASIGWGRFSVGAPQSTAIFESMASRVVRNTRWVSLSPCVPEEGYKGSALYRLLPHYGKLGGETDGVSVFKRPVLLLAAGACFTGPAPGGRWLRNVHPQRPEVLHYAFAYPLAC